MLSKTIRSGEFKGKPAMSKDMERELNVSQEVSAIRKAIDALAEPKEIMVIIARMDIGRAELAMSKLHAPDKTTEPEKHALFITLTKYFAAYELSGFHVS